MLLGPVAHLLLVTMVASALASCGTESPSSGPTREVLPNGAVVVRYSGLPAIGSVDRMVTEAQVDLEFGSLEGDDPNLTFGDIRGIQAASDGTIYVLDSQAAEVRAYDPDGQYLRTVVRAGEGPGEITEANGIILAGDTLLWLNDHSKRLIIGVDRAGQEVHRFAKPIGRGYGYMWDGAFDDRGRYWRRTFHAEGGFTYPPPPGLISTTARDYYVFYDLSSEAIDSVYLGERTFRSYTYEDPNGLWQALPIAFEPSDIFVLNPPGGFWRANSASYRIVRTGEGGDTLVVIEASVPVQRVTDEDRRAYVEGLVKYRPARRDVEAVVALMADVKPVLAGIFVDDEGVLWVERVVPRGAPAFYDRFSAEGDYLGSVRLAFEPAGKIWVQHGNIYSWVVDKLDVPYVVRAPLS